MKICDVIRIRYCMFFVVFLTYVYTDRKAHCNFMVKTYILTTNTKKVKPVYYKNSMYIYVGGVHRFRQSLDGGTQILPILGGGVPRFCQSSGGASPDFTSENWKASTPWTVPYRRVLECFLCKYKTKINIYFCMNVYTIII